jgi:hypothetical protein
MKKSEQNINRYVCFAKISVTFISLCIVVFTLMNHSMGAEESASTMDNNYEYDLNQIRIAVRSKDIDAVRETLVEIDQKWAQSDPISYVNLLRAACDEIRSQQFDGNVQAQSLLTKLATLAVEKADETQADVQLHLLVTCLRLHDRIAKLKPSEQPLERRASAALWLETWQKVEQLIDPEWDLNDPKNEVKPYGPPAGVVFPPGGAPPEAVKDPAIRAEYAAHLKKMEQISAKNKQQRMLRKVRTEYAGQVVDYITNLYSMPPFNIEELREQLAGLKYDDMRERILSAVSERKRSKGN